jgi:DNA-binding NarL/FixJ family response regulator
MATQCNQPIAILIVEDDPIMKLGLQHALATQPQFEIVGVAEDGFQGIELAIALQPALIIMDVGLPELDGIAATQKIKQQLPQIRVLMLTSHRSSVEIIAALSSGAEAYCIKGINFNSLLTAIWTVCDGATYLDAQIAQTVIEQLKPPEATNMMGELSQREIEILKLVVDGLSNAEIAEILYLSQNTVKGYLRSLMNKLVVNSRVQAAVVALRNGLV